MPAAPLEGTPGIANLIDLFGPIVIGDFLASIFWGISCTQLFLYFHKYDRDPYWLQGLVIFVWTINTGSLGLCLYGVFPVLILNWGRTEGLPQTQITLIHHIWVGGMATLAIQTYFIHRIFRYGRKGVFASIQFVLLMVLALFQFGGFIPYVTIALRSPIVETVNTHTMTSLQTACRAATFGCDVLIAASMIYLLLKPGLPVFKRSRVVVFRLITITINTGAWTAVFALANFILSLRYPDTLWFVVAEIPLGPLYVNMLLGNLNARDYIQQGLPSHHDTRSNQQRSVNDTIVLKRLNASMNGSQGRADDLGPRTMQVQVDRTVDIARDDVKQAPESENWSDNDGRQYKSTLTF